QGYDRNFTIAITACSAVMGVIIPPSILMLVWGGTMSISVGSLFLAGIVPGILLGLSMMVTVYVYAIKYKYPVYERSTFKEVVIATITSIPGLVTPIIIIGGIAFGIFTPTEASAIAVLYSLAVGVFNKSMTWKKFVAVLNDTAKLTGITLFCVGTASTFSWLLAYHRVPQALVEFVNAMQLGPVGIMMIISLIFLVVGMFIDAIPAIIIMGSILYPIAIHAGIHPIHFSLVGIVSLAFGLVTPPYGMCLLIASRIGEQQVPKVLKDVGIILLPMLGILLLLVLVPEVVLFLPRLIAPQFL
ncbi:MAG: C4-dicarboxylate ABC transporter permease, partial [Spirochaetae bacterium HGW-Spirochaetae-4]